MVKQFSLLLDTLILLSLLVFSARAAAQLTPPAMQAAAQDVSGTVWAVPVTFQGSNDTDGLIYRWQARHWVAQPVFGAAGFRQRSLARGDDGCVYVFWQKWDASRYQLQPQCLVTVHRISDSRIVARFSDPFPLASDTPFASLRSLWVGNGGDIWMADSSANLWHRAPNGTQCAFPLDPSQYFGGRYANGFPGQPLCSLTDRLGRRWFWQSDLNNGWGPNIRRGVLIWDGNTLAYHPTLPGLPDQSLLVVTSLDTDHFLVVASGNDYAHWPVPPGSLYRVDTRALSAVPITPPTKGAFQNILRVFRVNGDWVVLIGSMTNPLPPSLWRLHGAVWKKEPSSVANDEYGYNDLQPQTSLETPMGTWLAVNGAGLWWLPKGGKPAVRVDWRRGCPAGRVSALFRLPTGRILAFGTSGSAELPPLPHPFFPSRPEIVVGDQAVPARLTSLLADSRCHLWGLEYLINSQYALDEWDGKGWHKYPLPKSITGINGMYASDTRGRLWLATQNWDTKTQPQPVEGRAVYDPSHGTWANYAKVQDALQASASLPGLAFLPNHSLSQPPIFSGDGRVTYTDYASVFLGDGKTWHRWKPHDVQPGYTYSNFSSMPRFDQSGRLEVDLSTETWGWAQDGGWQLIGPVKSIDAPPLPPGGPKGYWGTPVTDNHGAQWVAWQNDIYLSRHGLWAKQPALSGLGSPFQDGRGLSDVLQDPDGRYFFLTNPGGNSEFVVWSPPIMPPPAPPIQITALSPYAVMLHFALTQPRAQWTQWRLNGGDWSKPQTTATVSLTALHPGRYRVEAQSVDRLLQTSPQPSAAVFVIQAASATQIARWVQTLLTGTETAREAAIAGLVQQPSEALPVLNAARPGASEPARWWIDAALQQITEHNSGNE